MRRYILRFSFEITQFFSVFLSVHNVALVSMVMMDFFFKCGGSWELFLGILRLKHDRLLARLAVNWFASSFLRAIVPEKPSPPPRAGKFRRELCIFHLRSQNFPGSLASAFPLSSMFWAIWWRSVFRFFLFGQVVGSHFAGLFTFLCVGPLSFKPAFFAGQHMTAFFGVASLRNGFN